MDLHEIIQIAAGHGFGAVFAVWIVWYVFKENTKREERLAGIIENYLRNIHNTLLEHDVKSLEMQKNFESAHDYCKEKHREIICILKNK